MQPLRSGSVLYSTNLITVQVPSLSLRMCFSVYSTLSLRQRRVGNRVLNHRQVLTHTSTSHTTMTQTMKIIVCLRAGPTDTGIIKKKIAIRLPNYRLR